MKVMEVLFTWDAPDSRGRKTPCGDLCLLLPPPPEAKRGGLIKIQSDLVAELQQFLGVPCSGKTTDDFELHISVCSRRPEDERDRLLNRLNDIGSPLLAYIGMEIACLVEVGPRR